MAGKGQLGLFEIALPPAAPLVEEKPKDAWPPRPHSWIGGVRAFLVAEHAWALGQRGAFYKIWVKAIEDSGRTLIKCERGIE